GGEEFKQHPLMAVQRRCLSAIAPADRQPYHPLSNRLGRTGEVPVMLRVIDSTLVIVLHNGEQEIAREPAAPADALRVALMMLARRGHLESGDVLKVMAAK